MKKSLVIISMVVLIMMFYTSCSNDKNVEKEQTDINTTANVSETVSNQETEGLHIIEMKTTKKVSKKNKNKKQKNKTNKKEMVSTKEHSTKIKKYLVVKDGTTREMTSIDYVTEPTTTTTTKLNKHTTTSSTTEEVTTNPHDLEPDFD